MSTQFLLDEDDIKELTKLMLVMIETQESRKQICRDLGINPQEVSFIIGTSDDTFCTELIDCLNRYGYQENLCKLCCDKLLPIFNKSVYSNRISILKKIVEKLNCNCNQETQNHPIPTVANPDKSKPESLFTKIGNFNKKLLAFGAILLIGLAGYPTYKHFKQPSQLDQDQELTQKAQLVQSEIEGNIGEHSRGGVLVKPITKVDLRNFIVEAQFDNPYDGTIMDNWTYGFAFIDNTTPGLNDPKRKGLDAWVDSNNKTWGFNSPNISLNGKLSNLNLSDKSSNKLRLTVNNKKAKFFVNDMYIETIDVSELTNKGSVFFTAGGGISGKSAQYQYKNLRVWSLDN
ncbi:hypothetical protein [Nostoc sp.]|uniref:hypothetical protein n=1 Tax=Nostoc sp. TaxID=1180 RepID=UPI002FFA4A46